ncbi:hypothetical protein A3860_15410 [Niastella vici]|uniref:Uncharacterized protein n=1 Tax=Niastella vici TaxID=1703345 RepID=A0A1V9G5Q9_9BACT|nr:hypothetical protein A3860_15410 [Niastella vici]
MSLYNTNSAHLFSGVEDFNPYAGAGKLQCAFLFQGVKLLKSRVFKQILKFRIYFANFIYRSMNNIL